MVRTFAIYVYLCLCIILCVILMTSFTQSSGKFLCRSQTIKILHSVSLLRKDPSLSISWPLANERHDATLLPARSLSLSLSGPV